MARSSLKGSVSALRRIFRFCEVPAPDFEVTELAVWTLSTRAMGDCWSKGRLGPSTSANRRLPLHFRCWKTAWFRILPAWLGRMW